MITPSLNNYIPRNISSKPKLDIETLVETRLPSSPGTVMRITELLRDYNVSSRKLTEAIVYEPALVTRILSLANSPIYALERSVVSVQTAIDAVGTKVISDIVLMELTAATFAKEIRKSVAAREIWEHSLAVALIARELSRILELRGTEEAFTCGLLHDIGKFILLSHDLEGYSSLLDENGENEMLRAEDDYYGYNHTEVGSLVVRRWGLPEDVCYAILHHHNPSESERSQVIAHIVDVADIIANIQGYGLRVEEHSKLERSESVMKLGFTEEHLENVWSRSQDAILDVIETFKW